MKATQAKASAPKFWELLVQVPVQAGKTAAEAKPVSVQALAKQLNQRRHHNV